MALLNFFCQTEIEFKDISYIAIYTDELFIFRSIRNVLINQM